MTRQRTTTPCRTIVAPMTVCGAMPADPIHGEGPPLSNGWRRHTYNWPPALDVDKAADILGGLADRIAWSVNGDTPWHVTLPEPRRTRG